MKVEPGPIRVVVDPDIEALIPSYLANLQEYAVQIADALARDDKPALAKLGHQLKGIGEPYGFNWVTQLGIALERGDADPGLADALPTYLQRVEIVYGP
jgi:hypothetical protein